MILELASFQCPPSLQSRTAIGGRLTIDANIDSGHRLKTAHLKGLPVYVSGFVTLPGAKAAAFGALSRKPFAGVLGALPIPPTSGVLRPLGTALLAPVRPPSLGGGFHPNLVPRL